jgi:hypothetical protein
VRRERTASLDIFEFMRLRPGPPAIARERHGDAWSMRVREAGTLTLGAKNLFERLVAAKRLEFGESMHLDADSDSV